MASIGKIARLTHEHRTRVNQMLRDGCTAREIAEWVRQATAGDTELTDPNVTAWRQGGYQDWLKNQQRIESMRARADMARDLVLELKKSGPEGTHVTEANELLIASQINEVLADFNPEHLKALLIESPDKFFNLVTSAGTLSNERTKRRKLELEFRKYKDAVEARKKEIQDALNTAKNADAAITAETIAEIEAKLNLL